MKQVANAIVGKFTELSDGHYKTALLYAGLAGAVVANLKTSPALAWAYYRMKVIQKQREDGLINASQAEEKIGQAYALAEPIWWVAVFAAVHFKKGGFYEKAKLAALLLGGGAVVGHLVKSHVKTLPQFKDI
jgi:hypothetical protein